MYAILESELRKKNISNAAVASLLNCTERTFYNKLHGSTQFTLNEAFLIHQNLLPEYNIDYLFTRA